VLRARNRGWSVIPQVHVIIWARPLVPLLKIFVETLTTESDVRSIEAKWSDLARDEVFTHPLWCLTWWECFRTPEMQLRVMVARNSDGDILGLAPLYMHYSPLMGRELRFLGDGAICSEYLSILAEPTLAAEVVSAIAEKLHQQGRSEKNGTWDVLDLDCYRTGDSSMSALKQSMQQRNHACHIDEAMGCWRIDFSEGWDNYCAKLSKCRRTKARRLLRQIQGEGPYQVKWVQRHTDIEEFMNHLSQLHQSRWQSKGELGCFANPRFGKFLRQVADKALACDRAHLLQVNYENFPVAIQFGLRSQSTIFSYQVGVDTTSRAESPGMAMNMLLIHDGFQRGLKFLDFLRGEEPYKKSLRAEKIVTQRLHVFARYPLADLRYYCWRTACQAKRWAKDWLKTPQKSNSNIQQDA